MKRYFIPRRCALGAVPDIFVWYAAGPENLPVWRFFSDPAKALYSQPQRARTYARDAYHGWSSALSLSSTVLSNSDYWVEVRSYGLYSVVNRLTGTCGSEARTDVLTLGLDTYFVTRAPAPPVKTNHKIGVPKGRLP